MRLDTLREEQAGLHRRALGQAINANGGDRLERLAAEIRKLAQVRDARLAGCRAATPSYRRGCSAHPGRR